MLLSRIAISPIATGLLAAACSLGGALPAQADAPLGWIHSDQRSAYTQDAWSVELVLGGLAVNEDIDVLNIREDLLAGTRALEGDSGDLSGESAWLALPPTEVLQSALLQWPARSAISPQRLATSRPPAH